MRTPTPTSPTTAPIGYTGLQIALHWTMALLILSQFLTGDWMAEFFDALVRFRADAAAPGGRPQMGVAVLHVVGGAAIIALGLGRFALRRLRGVPPDSPVAPAWDRVLAHLNHYALYGAFVLLPVTGLTAYLTANEGAGEFHETLTTVLLVLVGLHLAGALYHQLFLKDRLIRRMMVPVKPERHVPPARPN